MGCYVVLGDTIRLNAYFETFAGLQSDPLATTLYVYDEHRNTLVSATTTAGLTNGSTTGEYYYDYTTVVVGAHFYEFRGTLESKTISDRGTFYVTWS
jgi:hypothetical protein